MELHIPLRPLQPSRILVDTYTTAIRVPLPSITGGARSVLWSPQTVTTCLGRHNLPYQTSLGKKLGQIVLKRLGKEKKTLISQLFEAQSFMPAFFQGFSEICLVGNTVLFRSSPGALINSQSLTARGSFAGAPRITANKSRPLPRIFFPRART